MKRKWVYILGGAFFWGIFQNIWLREKAVMPLAEILIHISYGRLPFQIHYCVNMAYQMLPILYFQLVFGAFLYTRYCTASVYFFTRCQRRESWFFSQVLQLAGYSLVYAFLMVMTGILSVSLGRGMYWDAADAVLTAYVVFIFFGWIFISTLLINLLGILSDHYTAFALVGGLEMLCVGLLTLWEDILSLYDEGYGAVNLFLLKCNPVSHLVLSWHSSQIPEYNDRLNMLGVQFDLRESVAAMLAAGALCVAAGAVIVNRKDILSSDREAG